MLNKQRAEELKSAGIFIPRTVILYKRKIILFLVFGVDLFNIFDFILIERYRVNEVSDTSLVLLIPIVGLNKRIYLNHYELGILCALYLFDLGKRSARGYRSRGIRIARKAELLISKPRRPTCIELTCASKYYVKGILVLKIEPVHMQFVMVDMA